MIDRKYTHRMRGITCSQRQNRLTIGHVKEWVDYWSDLHANWKVCKYHQDAFGCCPARQKEFSSEKKKHELNHKTKIEDANC